MPFTFKNAQKSVAAFILVGVFLLIAVLILIGRGSDIFTFKGYYYSIYEEGYGLSAGTAVKYKGIDIGKINKIALTPDDKVRVDIWIDSEYEKLIRRDCVLRVQTGLLGANLELLPSMDPEANLLPQGSKITSSDSDAGRSFIALYSLSQKKNDPTARVNDLLDYVDSLKPVINKTMMNVREISENIKSITGGFDRNTKSALSDKVLASLDDLQVTVRNVKELTESVNSPNNSVGALLKDNKALYVKLDSMMNNVDVSLKNVKIISDKLKDSPEDIKKTLFLIQQNLIELQKVQVGIQKWLGTDKQSDKTIKAGDRNP